MTVFDEDEMQALRQTIRKEISFAEIKNLALQIEQHTEEWILGSSDRSSRRFYWLGPNRGGGGSSEKSGSRGALLVSDDMILAMVGARLREGELHDSNSLSDFFADIFPE